MILRNLRAPSCWTGILLAIGILIPAPEILAQSPPNNTAGFTVVGKPFNTVADIENTFNAARRAEEIQLGAPANSLGNLVLPPNWDSLSDHEKGFFLTNAERVARGGVSYTNPLVTPIGLPLEMVEANLQDVSVAHGNDMLANQFWSHTGSDGIGPYDRIANNPVLSGCLEFLPAGENLYMSCSFNSPEPRTVEKAVYIWIYDDVSSSNGHREAILLQDAAVPGGWFGSGGYTNNYAGADSEGFVGFHTFTALSTDYNPAEWPNACGPPSSSWSYHVAIFNVADPKATCANPGFGTPFDLSLLPVALEQIRARVEVRDVVLEWSTASEVRNVGFSVEHKNSDSFREIGFVKGNGTTETRHTYSYRIQDLAPGQHSVRLKQVDFDGAFEYSQEVELTVSVPDRYFMADAYPNPFNPATTITFAAGAPQIVRLSIFDIHGRLMQVAFQGHVEKDSRQTVRIDGASLPTGVYLARLEGESFSAAQTIALVK